MAPPFRRLCAQGCRAVGRGLVTLSFWTLWLVLILLLAAQTYVATTNELPVPHFVQRALEDRLAVSGIHAVFGRTIFDPSGRVLIENVRITLPGFEDSVVTAKAIYARLDPWALLADRFEPLDLRVTGVSLRVPALLSPSGRADEVVRDLDAAFLPRGDLLTVEYANCHLGKLSVSVEGGVRLSGGAGGRQAPLPIAELMAHSYGRLSREAADILGRVAALDHPILEVRLSPAEPEGATVRFKLESPEGHVDSPVALEASALTITGRYSPEAAARVPSEVLVTADRVALPGYDLVAEKLRARLRAAEASAPTPAGRSPLVLQGLEATAAAITTHGLTLRSPILAVRGIGPELWDEAQPKVLPPLHAEVQAILWDQPVAAQADVDVARRAASGRMQGAVGPEVFAAIAARWPKNLYLSLASPFRFDGEARFAPGWKFVGGSAWVAGQGVTYKQLTMNEVRGHVFFDGQRVLAPEAFAQIGEDYAGGSYEEDLATKDYRLLLDGALRPLDITPWILGAWWPVFFGNFSFPDTPPRASIDLRSCWTDGRKLSALVFFDGPGTVLRGVHFDRVRTRVFVRPQFDDGLEFSVTRGTGTASGTFARRLAAYRDPDSQTVDFAATSTLDPGPILREAGPGAPASLSVYTFAQPPSLQIQGRYSGPTAAAGKHLSWQLAARTAGEFRYQDFPFDGASAAVAVKDDEVTLSQVSAGFAGGTVSGHARVAGPSANRGLTFDLTLAGANLGRAITAVASFAARRAHQPPPPLRNFLPEKSDLRLDLSAAAEGPATNLLGLHGGGTVAVQGAELGQLRMLGLLSDLFRFTALRFTTARADFKLDGPKLVFPSVRVVGANSAIVASGTYALDRHLLDFRAKIEPFQESKSFPQIFMGAVLTPFSSLLEVKLGGTLDKPTWVLTNGPTNLLRTLGGEADATSAVPAPSPLKPH